MDPPQRSEKLAYTVKEAATLLSLSRSRVYELIHSQELETIKIGRSSRITARQLHTYIVSLESGSDKRPGNV